MKRFCKNEKGQALVEFALVLPFLLVILFGIIDFGWIYYNQLAISNSAREGARYAVVNTALLPGEITTTNRDNRIKAKILDVSPNTISQNMVITITYTNVVTPLSGDVTIKLTSKLRVLTPIAGVFYAGQEKNITAKVTMKAES